MILAVINGRGTIAVGVRQRAVILEVVLLAGAALTALTCIRDRPPLFWNLVQMRLSPDCACGGLS